MSSGSGGNTANKSCNSTNKSNWSDNMTNTTKRSNTTKRTKRSNRSNYESKRSRNRSGKGSNENNSGGDVSIGSSNGGDRSGNGSGNNSENGGDNELERGNESGNLLTILQLVNEVESTLESFNKEFPSTPQTNASFPYTTLSYTQTNPYTTLALPPYTLPHLPYISINLRESQKRKLSKYYERILELGEIISLFISNLDENSEKICFLLELLQRLHLTLSFFSLDNQININNNIDNINSDQINIQNNNKENIDDNYNNNIKNIENNDKNMFNSVNNINDDNYNNNNIDNNGKMNEINDNINNILNIENKNHKHNFIDKLGEININIVLTSFNDNNDNNINDNNDDDNNNNINDNNDDNNNDNDDNDNNDNNINDNDDNNESESEMVTCEICYTERKKSEIHLFPCFHSFCITCVKYYLELEICNGKVEKIPCLYQGCFHSFSSDEVKEFVDEEMYKKYLKFCTFALLRIDETARSCPFCEKTRTGKTDQLKIKCECGKEYCFDCKTAWHGGITCADQQKDYKKTEKYMKKKGAKSCPHCGTLTIWASGCTSIHCANCKKDWNWYYDDSDMDHDGLFRKSETLIERVAFFYPRLSKQMIGSSDLSAKDAVIIVTIMGIPGLPVTLVCGGPALALRNGRKVKHKISKNIKKIKQKMDE